MNWGNGSNSYQTLASIYGLGSWPRRPIIETVLNLQELTRIEPLTKDSHVALLKSGVRVPLSEAGYAKLRGVLGI